jgi:hypothetical protein
MDFCPPSRYSITRFLDFLTFHEGALSKPVFSVDENFQIWLQILGDIHNFQLIRDSMTRCSLNNLCESHKSAYR